MSDRDLLNIIKDMIASLGDIRISVALLNESIRNLPSEASLKSIESTILLESQRQHADLACAEDIKHLEQRVDELIIKCSEHLNRGTPAPITSSDTVSIVKAITDASVKTIALENDRVSTSEENDISTKKLEYKGKRFSALIKFWPLAAAGLFEFIKWLWPHISTIR